MMAALKRIEHVKERTGLSYPTLCKQFHVSYKSFERWRSRFKRKEPLYETPGPRKALPLPSGELKDKIKSLCHARKRSGGAGNLYRDYAWGISRRDFAYMVEMARFESNVEHRKNMRRIDWHAPGVIWAMDATKYGEDSEGREMHIQNIRDLSSQYILEPIAGEAPRGDEVAGQLRTQFERYGVPLVLKRDVGSEQKNSEVDDVLNEFGVIPLNSPLHYPPYNGSIEQTQHVEKQAVAGKLAKCTTEPGEHFEAYVEAAAHDLNHRPKPSLKGKNACRVFFDGKEKYRFSKRQRRWLYEWIKAKAIAIFNKMVVKLKEKTSYKIGQAKETAWRIAVEAMLRGAGFITVSINKKVLTNFPLKIPH